MMNIIKNHSCAIWLCCMALFCVVSIGFSQTTDTLERTLKVHEAYSFANELGIKANASGGQVEVRMYAKEYYTTGGRGDTDALLYGVYTNDNSTTTYFAKAWDITYVNDLCAIPVLGYFFCVFGGGPNHTEKSTKYKDRVMQIARKTELGQQGDFIYYENPEFQVIIELELNGSTTLEDVYNIKLPGVDDVAGLEFDPAVKNYTYPCPGAVGCDALADFKNVSTDADKKPLVIAHRGYHGMRGMPENNLAAVINAYNAGFRYVEVDLRMTADYVPIIFHDEYYGYTTDFTPVDNTSVSTWTEELTWNDIKDLKHRERYWDQNYSTGTAYRNDGSGNPVGTTVQTRLGSVANNVAIAKFDSLAQYIQGKDIMVYLDIKSVPTARNFETLKQCILIGAKRNVLHQLGIKVIRTNLPDGNPFKLYMPLDSAKQHLGNVYIKFKEYLNVHIVDYDPGLTIQPDGSYEAGNGPDFINDWLDEGNIVGCEFDPQFNPLFEASSLKNYGIEQYNYKSPWEYTKGLGYRTGIWSSTSLDPRGRPKHDPSAWGTGGVMQLDLSSWQHYKDNRGRMEVLSLLAPQYITPDRPDVVYNYLSAVDKINANTKR